MRRYRWFSISVAATAIAALVVGSSIGFNRGLSVTSEGLLSFDTQVALAANAPAATELTQGSYSPGNEVIEKRTRNSKTRWLGGNSYAWDGVIGAVHYQDQEGDWQEIDCTPKRINNAQLNGWLITQNGWRYALGQPSDKATDGWVGFGGKHGQHWFKFRLLRTGYLYWPDRSWQDIGGNPTYNRAKLTNNTGNTSIGSIEVNVSSIATWSDIWKTPGNGDLSIQWIVDGYGLKEEILVNQAARDWIAQNRPPSTPISDTYFGFVFQADWSDIPKCVRDGIELNPNTDDFADNGSRIELQNALSELLGFMPVSEVYVIDTDQSSETYGERIDSAELRKRFWKDGDGNTCILVGVSCDVLNNLLGGDLIFDPSVEAQVGTTGDDGFCRDASLFATDKDNARVGNDKYFLANYNINIFSRFSSVTIPSGATINTGTYYSGYGATSTGSPLTKVSADDSSNPSAPTNCTEYEAITLTTAKVDWDENLTSGAWNNSPELQSVIAELQASYDYSSGAAITIMHKDDGSATGSDNYMEYRAWDYNDHSKAPKLHIEYSTAEADISNAPSSKNYGSVSESSTYWSSGAEPSWPLVDGDAYFTVTNNGDACSVAFKATNFTGGNGWTLTTGVPSEDTVRLTVFIEGDGSGDGIALTTSNQTLIASLGASSDKDWELKMETPSSFTDGVEKTSTVTLTGTLL